AVPAASLTLRRAGANWTVPPTSLSVTVSTAVVRAPRAARPAGSGAESVNSIVRGPSARASPWRRSVREIGRLVTPGPKASVPAAAPPGVRKSVPSTAVPPGDRPVDGHPAGPPAGARHAEGRAPRGLSDRVAGARELDDPRRVVVEDGDDGGRGAAEGQPDARRRERDGERPATLGEAGLEDGNRERL